jgi:hypothetical protein
MAASEAKTQPNAVSPATYVAAVEHALRRRDGETMLALMADVTGWEPVMWGPSIIGYGRYDYVHDSGRSGSMCVVGFSPRKPALVLYGCDGYDQRDADLAALGEHKAEKGCIYIKNLEKIDLGVLRRMIRAGVDATAARYPTFSA